jgi:hypothetical protein
MLKLTTGFPGQGMTLAEQLQIPEYMIDSPPLSRDGEPHATPQVKSLLVAGPSRPYSPFQIAGGSADKLLLCDFHRSQLHFAFYSPPCMNHSLPADLYTRSVQS